MSETKHTKTPWERVDISTGSATKREQLNYCGISAMQIQHDGSEEGDANAAFIVQAVNSHEALVETMKRFIVFAEEVLPQAGKLCFDIGNLNEAMMAADRINAAIAKAKA